MIYIWCHNHPNSMLGDILLASNKLDLHPAYKNNYQYSYQCLAMSYFPGVLSYCNSNVLVELWNLWIRFLINRLEHWYTFSFFIGLSVPLADRADSSDWRAHCNLKTYFPFQQRAEAFFEGLDLLSDQKITGQRWGIGKTYRPCPSLRSVRIRGEFHSECHLLKFSPFRNVFFLERINTDYLIKHSKLIHYCFLIKSQL